MTRRNIDSNEIKSHLLLSYEYPSPDEIASMAREAQAMRAQAMADSVRWLWRLVTRRRAAEPAASSAVVKA